MQHYCAFSCTSFVPTFHIHSQFEILLHFSCHTFYKVVIGLFACSELRAVMWHTAWLLFQLPTWPVPCFFFCFWYFSYKLSILLLFHSSFFSLIQFCLNFFLITVSTYPIVSAALTPSINGSSEFLTYHPKLLCSIFIHLSQLINSLHPISLLRYTLSTSFLRYSTPCIVINFLMLLSRLFHSYVFHFRIHCRNFPRINCHNFITSIQFRC